LILGIVQGATEFLPVSSSGHLVLVPWLFGWGDPGLAFDATLHLGTLVAVVAYFARELWALLRALVSSLKERSLAGEPNRRIAWLLVVASVPAAVSGFLLEDFFESLFAEPLWVGALLLGTGALLALSEKWSVRNREISAMGWADAVIVGLGQALAIAPGISRSGATISAGLWRGLERPAAARFSFLLSVPVVLGAGLFKLVDLLGTPWVLRSPWAVLVGFVAAAVSGFLSIRFLLSYLQSRRLYPFAAYCWAAGSLAIVLSVLSIR
jgi:undecaprenyl-diphosphatase